MSFHKRKAFTLTELLVVVVVIGILSAVVLPKFSKVLETRKTTEAEELMSAVRTEQEKRCALDKKYLANASDVKDILPTQNTKNFAYNLTTTGMEATSKGKYGYMLKMPSYKDGRICCDNPAECAKLNKDYPLCSALIAQADYQSGAECVGDTEPSVKECSGSAFQSCGCKNGGTQTRTCNTATGVWSGWSACSISDACECSGSATQACGCNNKGTQSRSCNAATGTWSGWGSCSISDACECTGTKPAESQDCNECGTQTRSVTCNSTTGSWTPGAWSACSKTEEQCAEEKDCCADDVSASDFQKCILGKYGADSKEYICATGNSSPVTWGFGSVTGAASCSNVLSMGSGVTMAVGGTCWGNTAEAIAYCNEVRSTNASWIAGGFKKYACTGTKPTTPTVKPPKPPTEPEKPTFSCCKVEMGERKTFRYNDLFGQVECHNAGCLTQSQCPPQIQPGVYMNGSHGGLSCTYSCNCPFNGYGIGFGPYDGYVQKMRCTGSYTCTADDVVWL